LINQIPDIPMPTNYSSCTIAEMVEELGSAGMSSDESELDEYTKKTTYRIKRRLWRAKVG
jgi:hypothetical protein